MNVVFYGHIIMRLSERGQEQNGYGHVYVCVSSFFPAYGNLVHPI